MRRRYRERRDPHEEHAIDAVQARVECVGRGEITAHDFYVRRQIGGARIAAHCANPAARTAQLRDHLAADLAGRAGDEDGFQRRVSWHASRPCRARMVRVAPPRGSARK